MRVYCDTNIYSRPFDKVTHPRLHLEVESCIKLFALVEARSVILLSSDILKYEIEHSDYEKYALLLPLLKLSSVHIRQTIVIKMRAHDLVEEVGFAPRDALHIASAIEGQTEYFLTCDDDIIRRSKRIELPRMKVLNPIDFLYHHYGT